MRRSRTNSAQLAQLAKRRGDFRARSNYGKLCVTVGAVLLREETVHCVRLATNDERLLVARCQAGKLRRQAEFERRAWCVSAPSPSRSRGRPRAASGLRRGPANPFPDRPTSKPALTAIICSAPVDLAGRDCVLRAGQGATGPERATFALARAC